MTYVVQNEDLSDWWNDTAWITNAEGTEYVCGDLTPEMARRIADCLNVGSESHGEPR